MTVTATTRTPTYRRTGADVDPIVDAWVARYAPGAARDGFPIGYYVRQEDGDKERIANPVYSGDASNLYAAAVLVCNEDGSWF